VLESSPKSNQLRLSLGPDRQILRVSELNSSIQRIFESEFRNLWVAGEISGCRLAGSGHYYFSLKDEKSQIKCVLFKGAVRFAKFSPIDGLAVLARGKLEVYEVRGEYQLLVDLLEPQGAGALQLAFEQLKSRLAKEGLFASSRKRLLPKFPRRIALVTSLGGAVLLDMLHVMGRRFPGLHVRLYPAQVQGENAAQQICTAIEYFSSNEWAEVLIVARGGGTLEDLWTFNEESVARAVAGSRTPLISAIGHETDFTITDFVADHRAPTPSAAAEIAVCTRDSVLTQIEVYRARASQLIRYQILEASRALHRRGGDRAISLIGRILMSRSQRLDELEWRLQQWKKAFLDSRRKRFSSLVARLRDTNLQLRCARNVHRQQLLQQRLERAWRQISDQWRTRIDAGRAHLLQLSPLAVLERGYAVVQKADGGVLRSSRETGTGDELRIRLHHGQVTALVASTEAPDSADTL
jgi:exodeoxyribonuclease VII large subunit